MLPVSPARPRDPRSTARPTGMGRPMTEQQTLIYIPVGVIVAVVLVLYNRIRQSDHHERLAVREAELSTEAEQARARAAELAALVQFSQALSLCRDAQALRRTLFDELPRLVGHQRFWLRTHRSDSGVVISPGDAGEVIPAGPEAWETFPLVAGGRNVGVLGIQQDPGPLPESQRRTVELAALMLAVTVRNVQLFERITEFSILDAMTGCLTRQQGLETFAAEMRRAQRTKTALSVMLLEIDDFRAVTDQYVPAVADEVLVRLGRLFKRELRASDLRCRYGPSRFAFMLPDTGVDGAVRAAHDLRQKIATLSVTAEGEQMQVTGSIGVGEVLASDVDPLESLKRAEAGLNRAMAAGGNSVAVHEQPTSRYHADR